MVYDIIIIGMGPAGMSAAIYAKRANAKILILEKGTPGGLINQTEVVHNYPGIYETSGPDLAFSMFDQINKMEIPYKMTEVLNVIDGNPKKVVTKDETYYANKIIIATGRVARRLGLPNEEDFIGHGISNCALCDGTLYKDKDVLVVGGGNSALEESIYLSKLCHKVYLIHRRDAFRADQEVQERVKEIKNIELMTSLTVSEIHSNSEGKLCEVVLSDGTKLAVEGMFVYIGYVPKTDFAKELDICNQEGYINVDEHYQTKISGIYAVGDIVDKEVYQIVTAVSDGAIAAIHATK